MLLNDFIKFVRRNNPDAHVGIDDSGVVCSFQHKCLDDRVLGIKVVVEYPPEGGQYNCGDFLDRVSEAKEVLQDAVNVYDKECKMKREEFIELVKDNFEYVQEEITPLGVSYRFRQECTDRRIFGVNINFTALEIAMSNSPHTALVKKLINAREMLQDSVDAHEASLGD